MSAHLETVAWPESRVGEALAALARRSGVVQEERADTGKPEARSAGDWIEAAAAWMGFEVEPVELRFGDVERRIQTAAPALLRLPGDGEGGFLALLGGSPRSVLVLGPDLAVHRLPAREVRAAICEPIEAPHLAEVNRLLEGAGISRRRRGAVRDAVLRDKLGSAPIGGCWVLRAPPGISFFRQLQQAGMVGRLALLILTYTAEYILWILSWWVVGRAVLQGRLDRGWLLAWAALLIALVPFRVVTTWLQGRVAIGVGALLKKRLLYGALCLEPDEIRHQGAGQLLGRVLESEAVESLALSGGILGLVGAIELLVAAVVLSRGAAGAVPVVLLGLWIAATILMAWRYFRRYGRWSEARLEMTNDQVERMVGHRTRLAQEPRDRWHQEEDQALASYLERSMAMDRSAMWLMALVPRGWLVLGVAGLAPAVVFGQASPAALAVALGGVLLVYRALRRLSAGIGHIAGAGVAWRQVAPLFHAAARPQVRGAPALAMRAATDGGRALVEARDVVFRYQDRGEPVLRGCSLQVWTGDRVLLEGPSGGGKSTLAAVLMGMRAAQSGAVLVGGLDRQTIGSEGWRKRITAAPQFHENHVLAGTFAFNLLMGRRWPPRPEDLEEAESICRDLGLDGLLERMPAGLLQMVGETGWQLSHGERSRLYIARALLQGADVVVLDESFAALDPENLRQALACVLARAPALIVIAHP